VYKPHLRCRVCSSKELVPILNIGVVPLANDFRDSTQKRAGYAPLEMMWCPKCTLAQTSVVVDRDVLYKNYSYVTSPSNTMREHFVRLLEDLCQECKTGTVIEIGSNDGSFLKYCLTQGFKRAIGIDPADNLCDLALKKGVHTINDYFTCKVATELDRDDVQPDLIVARHVFCHMEDWHEAIHALGVLCGKETVIAIEVPHLVETLTKCEWDQIYHEHLSYMTITAMKRALQNSMLHIHGVKHYPIHGGAIVLLLRRNDSVVPPQELPVEEVTLKHMAEFSERAQILALELGNRVKDLVSQGKTVVGYGASAKATQWIQMCGFSKKHIKYVCDNTPEKQNKFMPGTDIPVAHSDVLSRNQPDYSVLFAWNWRNECISKEKNYSGKWIIPVPQLEIV
jgi:novobiocin biosynthesis protein NovU/D-mycarose 3-C-methyltransferase